jgi:hypothetical protein
MPSALDEPVPQIIHRPPAQSSALAHHAELNLAVLQAVKIRLPPELLGDLQAHAECAFHPHAARQQLAFNMNAVRTIQ